MDIRIFIVATIAYMGILFGIAYFTDRRRKRKWGSQWVANPYIYSLSLAVYCTAWTFYGSVGKAARSGVGFLPIYLGPTILAPLWWLILRKMIVISKNQRITSIADFISSRYGKSTYLGILVTLIALFGIIPYISLQLKAISDSLNILSPISMPPPVSVALNRVFLKVPPFMLRLFWRHLPCFLVRANSNPTNATREWSSPSLLSP